LPPVLNLQHTLQVRKAFAQDKELAALNLGVTVENRIATLWGPAPSTELLNKAVKVARAVPDILEVRCYMFVVDAGWPEPKTLPDPAGAVKPPVAPTPGLPLSKNSGGPWIAAEPPAPGKTTMNEKTQNPWQPAITEKHDSFKPMPVQPTGHGEDQALFVLPAIAVPAAPANGNTPSSVPFVLTLKDRVLQLKGNDPRYQYLDILVEENRVYLNGLVYQWGDLQQLTKAIAQTPGVQNVIVGQVQIKAQK
jgi:hypothetical protein